MPTHLLDDDAAELVHRFGRWQHPSVRDPGRAFVAGDGTSEDVEWLLGLVFRIADVQVQLNGTEAGMLQRSTLRTDLIKAVQEMLSLPERNREQRRQVSRQIALGVEPWMSCLLWIVNPGEHARMFSRARKPGAGALFTSLCRLVKVDYSLVGLSDEQFRSHEGWELRTSLENAVRDYLELRNATSHEALEPQKHHWESAFVVLLGCVDAARKAMPLDAVLPAPVVDAPANRILPGLPPHRRIPPDAPEPFITRAQATESWARVLDSEASRGAVYMLEASPGWGKSAFLVRCLGTCSRPVHCVDAAEADTPHMLAEAMLTGLVCNRAERTAVDQTPMHATRVLASRLGTSGVVVFENIQQNSSGRALPQVLDAARILADQGSTVIIESWTRESPLPLRMNTTRVRQIPNEDLMPISDAEISVWALRILCRELTSVEKDCLGLMLGNPMSIKAGLLLMMDSDLLAETKSAEDLFLSVACTLASAGELYNRFVAGRMQLGPEAPMPIEVVLWLGLLPWSRPERRDLPPPIVDSLAVLTSLGLVVRVGERFESRPWGRVMSLDLLQRSPLNSNAADLDWLVRIALTVTSEFAKLQQRQLAAIGTRLQSLRSVVQRLRDAVACVPESDPVMDPIFAAYVAPAELYWLERHEETTETAEFASAAVEAVGTFDAEIASWLLGGAVRRLASAEVAEYLQQISQSPAATAYVLSSADSLRTITHALGSIPPQVAARFVEAVREQLLDSLNAPTDYPSVTLWRLRLSLRAGDALVDVLDWTGAAACLYAVRDTLSRADSIMAWLFRQIRDDLLYRTEALSIRLATAAGAVLESHARALSKIPQPEDWGTGWSWWASRTIRHVRALIHTRREEVEWLPQLRTALNAMPPSAEKWVEIERLLRDGVPAQTAFHAMLLEAMESSVEGLPEADLHRFIGRLLLEKSILLKDLENSIERIVGEADAGLDPLSLVGLRLSLLRIASLGRRSGRTRAVVQSVLDLLASTRSCWWTREQTSRLRSTALGAFVSVELSDFSHKFSDRSCARSQSDFAAVCRRILATFRRQVSVSTDGTIWDDFVRTALRLESEQRLIMRRLGKDHDNKPSFTIDNVLSILDEAQHSIGVDHPAALLAVFRVNRLRQHTGATATAASRLLDGPARGFFRARALRVLVDGLAGPTLAPEVIPRHDRDELGPAREAFVRALSELSRIDLDPRRRLLGMVSVSTLIDSDATERWTDLLSRAQPIVGPPELYWRRISNIAGQPDRGGIALSGAAMEDLTDAATLRLVSQIFRYGAGNPRLPDNLRLVLAETAYVVSRYVEAWERSSESRGRPAFVANWETGLSIGLGLIVSPDGRFLGSSYSEVPYQKGTSYGWKPLLWNLLGSAKSGASGVFRERVTDAKGFLRQAIEVQQTAR